jgi:DNA-directed RNA polymerase subunit RPC12/RpoP
MHVTYACPHCHATTRSALDEHTTLIACSHCGHQTAIPARAVSGGLVTGEEIHRCVVCPSKELFARKNFPQRLGVAIVVIGFALSCITWNYRLVVPTFAILFATAASDVVLYFFMGNVLECYRCQARYAGGTNLDEHGPFDLEVHERFRQEKIRLAERE